MKNGNNEHDFDSVAQLLRQQSAGLEVLLWHLAHAEATLFALTSKTLSDENFRIAKVVKDHTYREIYSEMIAEAKRNLDL